MPTIKSHIRGLAQVTLAILAPFAYVLEQGILSLAVCGTGPD